jgi:hypothetical protein
MPLNVIGTHANLLDSTSKNADDVVITLAIRTPLTKGFKGGFKDTELDYLLYALMKKVIEKSKLDPKLVEDICCGNVCPFELSNLLETSGSNIPIRRSPMAKQHTNSVPLPLQLASQTQPPPPQ